MNNKRITSLIMKYNQGTGTIIGGRNAGKMCHFPFEYGGVEHNNCIMDDSSGQPWCSTSYQLSNDTLGNCSCLVPGNKPGLNNTLQHPYKN